MTALIVMCPHCQHRERLDLAEEDTFMALGEQIGPNTFQMLPESEMSVFEAAQLGWSGIETANQKIGELSAEYDRILGSLEAVSELAESHGPFVASVNRELFHRPQCKWAEYFLHRRSCEVFETHEQAVAAGKRPCRTCCA